MPKPVPLTIAVILEAREIDPPMRFNMLSRQVHEKHPAYSWDLIREHIREMKGGKLIGELSGGQKGELFITEEGFARLWGYLDGKSKDNNKPRCS